MVHLELLLKWQAGTWRPLQKVLFKSYTIHLLEGLITSVSVDLTLPMFLCATRWVEDKKVAERLLEIWSLIPKVVAFWLKLLKSKQPKCKSFGSVREAVEDELTTVRLSFFSYLASIFQPLAKYQTQAPMILHMYSGIVKLIRSLMKVAVKHGIIDGCMFGQDLRKIDLDRENAYKKKKEFNLGFAAENKLKALQRRYLVKKEAVTNFLDNVRCCVVTILKMFKKSPIGSVIIVRNASVLNPGSIFVTKEEDVLKNLNLLHHFVKIKVQGSYCFSYWQSVHPVWKVP